MADAIEGGSASVALISLALVLVFELVWVYSFCVRMVVFQLLFFEFGPLPVGSDPLVYLLAAVLFVGSCVDLKRELLDFLADGDVILSLLQFLLHAGWERLPDVWVALYLCGAEILGEVCLGLYSEEAGCAVHCG